MSWVFVLDPQKWPLAPATWPCTISAHRRSHAAVWRRFPFTIIRTEVRSGLRAAFTAPQDRSGIKTTGLAVLDDTSGQVVWAGELAHRGQQVKEHLEQRRACRRSRRQRHTRYRPTRYRQSPPPRGVAPPIAGVTPRQRAHLGRPSVPLLSDRRDQSGTGQVRYHLLQNPEISGVEYQQGELAGYEVRQYLLEKFGHTGVPIAARPGPAGDRTHRPTLTGRIGPGLQSHHRLPCLQPGERRPDGRRVRASRGAGAGEGAAAGRGSYERDALGAVSPAGDRRALDRDGIGRSDEIQPDAAGLTQDPLAGCQLHRLQYASGSANAGDRALAHRSAGASQPADVSHQFIWLSG